MGQEAHPTASEPAGPRDQSPCRRVVESQRRLLPRSANFSIREIALGLALALSLFPSYSPWMADQETGSTPDQAMEEAGVGNSAPLLLEVPLPVKFRIPLKDRPKGTAITWNTAETVGQDCDGVRVDFISITKTKMYLKGRHHFDVSLQISSERYRHDVNLTVSLVTGDQEIERKAWKSMTVGEDENAGPARAAAIEMPTAQWRFTDEEIAAWFTEEERPILRMTIEIQ